MEAIEVPDSRYDDFVTAGAPQLLADNACADRFVLGPAAPEDWRRIDLDLFGRLAALFRIETDVDLAAAERLDALFELRHARRVVGLERGVQVGERARHVLEGPNHVNPRVGAALGRPPAAI